MRTTAQTQTAGSARRLRVPGFTLIELLVVIVIVTILVALVTAVGSGVLAGGKSRQTADAIRVVDAAVDTYYATVGTAPPAFVVAFSSDGPELDGNTFTWDSYAAYPLADAVDVTETNELRTRINSMGLFIRAMENEGLGDVFSAVSSDLLTRWDGDADFVEPNAGATNEPRNRQPELRTVIDGWGNPLRFVHPAWDGVITREANEGNRRPDDAFGESVGPIAPDSVSLTTQYWLASARAPTGFDPADVAQFPIQQIRRDRLTEAERSNWSDGAPVGDADGGYTVGGRPYVYSAGPPEGRTGVSDPSTIENNVYSTMPRFFVD